MNQPQKPNVAVLRIPLADFDKMTAQAQMLMIMQQMLSFMASEYFGSMDGVQVVAADVNNIAGSKIVFQAGQQPDTGIIKIN